MKQLTITLLSLLAFCAAHAQDETSEKLAAQNALVGPSYHQITNIASREALSLCGDWDAIVDQYDNGYYNYRMVPKKASSTMFADEHYYKNPQKKIEYDFDCADTLRVPGDWNTQSDKLYYYEGSIWYRKVFDFNPQANRRYFVYFGAVNYDAVCALNGKILGEHIGGFTPFDFEVTDLLKQGDNSLIVKVNNNRHKDAVPTLNCDWWNYGGITREVKLVSVAQTFVRDYCVGLSKDGKKIEGWVKLDGPTAPGTKVCVGIPELGLRISAKAGEDGLASFSHKAAPELWSPSNPKLYDVQITCADEVIEDRIGFRTISTRGTEILLNGEPIFCKGISIHEESMDKRSGRAWSEEHARKLLGAAKELGCNFVRLAHYPHNENMTRLADEMGIMVWSEIPVYWTISWTNPGTLLNALNQLEENITRDRNRASIIIWSVANETPRSPERFEFLGKLMDRARELDSTRLVSAAMEKKGAGKDTYTVEDELLEKADLISFNQYLGWYDGGPDKVLRAKWVFPVEKPVVVTELGAGVKYGYHAGKDVPFSEEYGVEVYKAQIKMLSEMRGLAGVCPWILKDFRSPRRQLHGIQDDFNRKGLLSETGEVKDVFNVLSEWYHSK